MTTLQRTLSMLAMTALIAFTCTPTDAMARGHNHNRHNHHNNKRIVHVEKRVVKHQYRGHHHRGPHRYAAHYRAPRHVVRHYAPRPFGFHIHNGHVGFSLPGLHIY